MTFSQRVTWAALAILAMFKDILRMERRRLLSFTTIFSDTATLPLGRERHFEEIEDNAECKLKIGNIFCESRAPLSTIVSPPNILFKDSPFEASAPTKGCH